MLGGNSLSDSRFGVVSFWMKFWWRHKFLLFLAGFPSTGSEFCSKNVGKNISCYMGSYGFIWLINDGILTKKEVLPKSDQGELQ